VGHFAGLPKIVTRGTWAQFLTPNFFHLFEAKQLSSFFMNFTPNILYNSVDCKGKFSQSWVQWCSTTFIYKKSTPGLLYSDINYADVNEAIKSSFRDVWLLQIDHCKDVYSVFGLCIDIIFQSCTIISKHIFKIILCIACAAKFCSHFIRLTKILKLFF
jgi:hypothetical protein